MTRSTSTSTKLPSLPTFKEVQICTSLLGLDLASTNMIKISIQISVIHCRLFCQCGCTNMAKAKNRVKLQVSVKLKICDFWHLEVLVLKLNLNLKLQLNSTFLKYFLGRQMIMISLVEVYD